MLHGDFGTRNGTLQMEILPRIVAPDFIFLYSSEHQTKTHSNNEFLMPFILNKNRYSYRDINWRSREVSRQC